MSDKELRQSHLSGANFSRTQRADEMRAIVLDAAEPVRPGEIVKAQMRRAWSALGRPAFWRVKDAWLGYAGKWRDEAVHDFRERARSLERQRAEAAEERAEMAQRLSALCSSLEARDPDFHGPTIDALRWAIGRCGR